MEEFLRTDGLIDEAATLIVKIEGSLKRSTFDTTESLQRCNKAWTALLAIREPIWPFINQARALQDEEEEGEGDEDEWEEEGEVIDRAQLINEARALLSKEYIQNILGEAADVLFDALDVYELYGDGIEEAA